MKWNTIHYSVIGVVTLCVFCFSLSGWAQSQNAHPSEQLMAQASQNIKAPEVAPVREQGGYGDIRINWQQLGLSKEQKAQMLRKRREFQINTAEIREKLKFAEQDLRAEMLKDPVDRSKIDSLLNDVSTLKQQMSEAAVQNLLAIKSLLTEEQLGKLAELQAQIPRELQGLKLSSEQRSQIQEIMKGSMRQNREVAGDLRELRTEIRDMLLSSQEVDPEKLNQLQADIAEKELALEKGRIVMLLQMKAVLTPEQLKAYQKIRAKREGNVPARQKKP